MLRQPQDDTRFVSAWPSFVRRDMLLRVPILEMARHPEIGASRQPSPRYGRTGKRVPPSESALSRCLLPVLKRAVQ